MKYEYPDCTKCGYINTKEGRLYCDKIMFFIPVGAVSKGLCDQFLDGNAQQIYNKILDNIIRKEKK